MVNGPTNISRQGCIGSDQVSQEDSQILILTRRTGEALFIGDDVEVTVLGVKGNQVRIGITAPKETPVNRAEISKRMECNGGVRSLATAGTKVK